MASLIFRCVAPPCSILHPPILWAQRSDTILFTIDLTDIRDEKFSLNETALSFSGVGGVRGNKYECIVEFLKEVVPQVGVVWAEIAPGGRE